MSDIEAGFHDKKGYLEKMSHSLQEKLKITNYIDRPEGRFLDVGCADGTVTKALAHIFPEAGITGIDIQGDFIEEASREPGEPMFGRPTFEKAYLWEMRERGKKYDVVSFIS